MVRLHPGGDFLKPDGEFDSEYMMAWRFAMGRNPGRESRAPDRSAPPQWFPRILAFTHVYDSKLPVWLGPWISLFASVHSPEDLRWAAESGFTRFALAMEEKHYEWHGGPWLERFGKRFLVCPAIREKLPDCSSCRYCWREWGHGGHVAFPEHSQPRWDRIRRLKTPLQAPQRHSKPFSPQTHTRA